MGEQIVDHLNCWNIDSVLGSFRDEIAWAGQIVEHSQDRGKDSPHIESISIARLFRASCNVEGVIALDV